MTGYIIPTLILSCVGLFFGVSLGYASKRLKVEVDPKVERILELLPCANCGACGKAGCNAFAESLVEGTANPIDCIPGGQKTAKSVSEVLGVEAAAVESKVACVHCGGDKTIVEDRFLYKGLSNCKAAELVGGGSKECTFGCLGFGTCKAVCLFGAIEMEKGLPVISEDKCTACGKCVESCPRSIISLIPRYQKVYVRCVSKDKGKSVKDICRVGCIGCTLCEKMTPSKLVTMKDNLPQVPEKWEDYEAAVGKCPTKCLIVREV